MFKSLVIDSLSEICLKKQILKGLSITRSFVLSRQIAAGFAAICSLSVFADWNFDDRSILSDIANNSGYIQSDVSYIRTDASYIRSAVESSSGSLDDIYQQLLSMSEDIGSSYGPEIYTRLGQVKRNTDIIIDDIEYISDQLVPLHNTVVGISNLVSRSDVRSQFYTNNLYLAGIYNSITNLDFSLSVSNLSLNVSNIDYRAYFSTNNLRLADIAFASGVSTQILDQIKGYTMTNAHLLMQAARISDETSIDGFLPSISISVTNTFEAMMLSKIYDLMRTNSTVSVSGPGVYTNLLLFTSPFTSYGASFWDGYGSFEQWYSDLFSYIADPSVGNLTTLLNFWQGSMSFPFLMLSLLDWDALESYDYNQFMDLYAFSLADGFGWPLSNPEVSAVGRSFNLQYGTYGIYTNSVEISNNLRLLTSNLNSFVSSATTNSWFNSSGLTRDFYNAVSSAGGRTGSLDLAYSSVPSNRVDEDTSQYSNSTLSGLIDDLAFNSFSNAVMASLSPFFLGLQNRIDFIETLNGQPQFTIEYHPYFHVHGIVADAETTPIQVDGRRLIEKIRFALQFLFFVLKFTIALFFGVSAWRYLIKHRLM